MHIALSVHSWACYEHERVPRVLTELLIALILHYYGAHMGMIALLYQKYEKLGVPDTTQPVCHMFFCWLLICTYKTIPVQFRFLMILAEKFLTFFINYNSLYLRFCMSKLLDLKSIRELFSMIKSRMMHFKYYQSSHVVFRG